jgi:hypothetical protein
VVDAFEVVSARAEESMELLDGGRMYEVVLVLRDVEWEEYPVPVGVAVVVALGRV